MSLGCNVLASARGQWQCELRHACQSVASAVRSVNSISTWLANQLTRLRNLIITFRLNVGLARGCTG